MENTEIYRLQILIDEVGGDREFIQKLDNAGVAPDVTINEGTLKSWLDGNSKIELYNAYLIAKAFHVSMNWLLGLTGEKNKNIVFFKRPATYGDVLIFLDQIFETGTAGLGNPSHDTSGIEIFADDGLMLPQYIMINDKTLCESIKKLSDARSLNENDFIDSLEETCWSKLENPQQYCGSNNCHNKKHPRPSAYTGDHTDKELLSYNELIGKIAEQLEKLRKGISYKKFADKIGCPKSTLSDWINKNSMPYTDNLCLVASKLEKSVNWILGMDEIENRNKFYKGESYTYVSVLYILGHLIAKGTIGFVDELSSLYDDNDEISPKMDDLFRINDAFLFCLLLRMESLKCNSDLAPKGKLEQLFEKYKNTPLLTFNIENKNLISDINNIRSNTKGNKRYRDIDLDRLYENLQTLK